MSRGRAGYSVALGFTLVELLVVIAIMGLLACLLLPAIQAARETSRRMVCLNNLRQIGLGMLDFHNAYKRFPEGGVEMRTLRLPGGQPRFPHGRQLAWSAYILPYVELQSLARRIDFAKAFDSAENAAAAAEIVPIYLCPSFPRKTYLISGRGACDYGGIYGEALSGPNNPPKGVMLYAQYVCIRDIIDGTAHTMMVSEDSGWPDGQWINGTNVFDVAYPINKAPAIENDLRSKHPGGVNGLFCDANARFLSEELDQRILAALCTRAGKEPLGEF
jgi:prepilin-type N-terminal cleavage/methylation domain-containing protein/prepilin-type processing-associated H-X9-DG protein